MYQLYLPCQTMPDHAMPCLSSSSSIPGEGSQYLRCSFGQGGGALIPPSCFSILSSAAGVTGGPLPPLPRSSSLCSARAFRESSSGFGSRIRERENVSVCTLIFNYGAFAIWQDLRWTIRYCILLGTPYSVQYDAYLFFDFFDFWCLVGASNITILYRVHLKIERKYNTKKKSTFVLATF